VYLALYGIGFNGAAIARSDSSHNYLHRSKSLKIFVTTKVVIINNTALLTSHKGRVYVTNKGYEGDRAVPRHRQRFSDLNRVLRASKGVVPAESRVGNYLEYLKGNRKIDVKHQPAQNHKNRHSIGLIPFNLNVVEDTPKYYKAAITAWSEAGRKTHLSLTNNDLGYEDSENAEKVEGYYPAALKVAVRGVNTALTTPRSGITNKEYKRKLGFSYTVPFGRSKSLISTVTTLVRCVEEQSRVALTEKIRKEVTTGVAIVSIGYDPERFRTRGSTFVTKEEVGKIGAPSLGAAT
jgi:hypothetical protein